MEENITLTLTKEEVIVLNNILDLITKHEGLRIAETTVYLSKKLKSFLDNKIV